MDDQTVMVYFEAMRRPAAGRKAASGSSSSRRQLLITHAELDRQCDAKVRGFESDTRMALSELRRDEKKMKKKASKDKSRSNEISKGTAEGEISLRDVVQQT